MLPDLAMQMLLLVLKATVLLAFASALLHFTRSRFTAAGRHLICAATLTCLILLVAVAGFTSSSDAAPWPVFHLSVLSSSATSQSNAWLSWPHLVLGCWLLGSIIFGLRLLTGWTIIARASHRFPHAGNAWLADLERLAAELKLDPDSISLRTGNINSPVACGVFSPAILLPSDSDSWDGLRRRTVLLHELAHIRRRDCLWQRISGIACAMFWFHPLVWRLASQLRHEQELACDDAVLAAGTEPGAYAALLLNAAQGISSPSLFACPFHGMPAAVQLRARIANILQPRTAKSRRDWARAFVAALGCLLLAMSSVSLARAEKIYRIGGDVTMPVLIHKVEPDYTPEAKAAKIQGTTILSVVIGSDGRVHSAEVLRSLDPGLDANAIKAIQQWIFKPATRNGTPVAVRANVEVNFRLK